MTVVAFVPGLMDRSRFEGLGVVFVSSGRRALELAPTVIYVDLDRCPTPAEFRLDGAHVVGFAAHVEDERLEAGRAAGFDDVAGLAGQARDLAGKRRRSATPSATVRVGAAWGSRSASLAPVTR